MLSYRAGTRASSSTRGERFWKISRARNGTYLRGRRIEAPRKLADEDQVMIGPASMTFRVFKQTASTAAAVEK